MDPLDRMVRAVERVHKRLRRSCDALKSAGIPYAVIRGHASSAWIATVDASAMRNSQKIEILPRRTDFTASLALESVGFIGRDGSVFLDGPHARNRDAVQMVSANERRWVACELPTPDVIESRILRVAGAEVSVIELESLVRMNLDSFKLDDRVDLEDMIDVELIDSGWRGKFGPRLEARLQEMLDEVERERFLSEPPP